MIPSPADPTGGDIVVACVHPTRDMPSGNLAELARRVLDGEHCRWTYVGIVLDGRANVHRLNREYLGHDRPTDVLSFTIDRTDDGLEGEVYVDLDTAAENAIRFGTTYEQEVARYVVHGLLHLAGRDDATDDDRELMRALEDSYLTSFRSGSPPAEVD